MSTVSPDSPDIPRPIGEIVQGPSAFEQFLDRNQRNLVILSIVLALAAAGLVIYRGISSSKEHTAGADLNKAQDLAALRAVVKDHAGTAAADSAEVLLAARQWADGQQDAAIDTLKAFVAAKPNNPARPTAQASLGSMLKSQGKTADAKKVFQELADDPSARFMAPYALLSLGDIAKTSGDTEQAEKFYQKAKTEFPDSSFSNIATKRVSLLKAKMPVEIAPPPPPPTPPGTPGAPGAPTAPGTPGAPAAPAAPATPAIPAVPATPGTPAAPATPATPETPAAPAAPATPAKPETPAAPATPETPASPSPPPATPAAPAPVQEKPAEPRNDPGTQPESPAPASPSKP